MISAVIFGVGQETSLPLDSCRFEYSIWWCCAESVISVIKFITNSSYLEIKKRHTHNKIFACRVFITAQRLALPLSSYMLCWGWTAKTCEDLVAGTVFPNQPAFLCASCCTAIKGQKITWQHQIKVVPNTIFPLISPFTSNLFINLVAIRNKVAPLILLIIQQQKRSSIRFQSQEANKG